MTAEQLDEIRRLRDRIAQLETLGRKPTANVQDQAFRKALGLPTAPVVDEPAERAEPVSFDTMLRRAAGYPTNEKNEESDDAA